MSTETPDRLLRLRHGLEYAVLSAIAGVLRAVPRRAALEAGATLGQIGWWIRIRRRLVLDNLERALPTVDTRERRRIAARAARNFGRTICELLRNRGIDSKRILDLVEIEGRDLLEDALAEGRGAVLVTGHLGAWALYGIALGIAGVRLAILVGVQTNPRVDQIVLGISDGAVQVIPKGKGSPRDIVKALRDNKVIVMVADHYSSEQRVLVPFLGHDAYTLPLPGALVARHRLPLLRMVGRRIAGGRHHIELSRIPIPEIDDESTLRREIAVRCNESLGEAILRHPDQYFWYHNRWKMRHRAR